MQPNVPACFAMDYRACKHCQAVQPATLTKTGVISPCDAGHTVRSLGCTKGDVSRFGIDPPAVRRRSWRHFGMTLLEVARQRRIRDGFERLSCGGKVVWAQLDAGYGEAKDCTRLKGSLLLSQRPKES